MVFKLLVGKSHEMLTFENDVKEYGIQTPCYNECKGYQFENDVKEYGIQTK